MNVLSKFDIDNNFLDIESGEYNLGVVPNLIIDKMIHEMRFADVIQDIQQKSAEYYTQIFFNLWFNIDEELEDGILNIYNILSIKKYFKYLQLESEKNENIDFNYISNYYNILKMKAPLLRFYGIYL